MTQEDKELLLKDLCGRLPYGVKYQDRIEGGINILSLNIIHHYERFIPYLRPMSSMTDEEKVEIQDLYHQNTQEVFKDPSEIRGYRFYDISVVDWLNTHHFDYRGLIEKGLALEAPKGIYNAKEK